MTTNVINKGWFNPISLTVLLVLISVSIILSVLQILNPLFRIIGYFYPHCRPVGAGSGVTNG